MIVKVRPLADPGEEMGAWPSVAPCNSDEDAVTVIWTLVQDGQYKNAARYMREYMAKQVVERGLAALTKGQ